MILYTLRCDSEHEFESWFKDSAAFDKQAKRKLVACPHCGSTAVQKAIMAPRVARGRGEAAEQSPEQSGGPTPGQTKAVAADPAPLDPKARALRAQLLELRRQVEANCDYVGPRFAEEARRIHYGESDPRGIYGESSREEAEALAEEGVAVARLPWIDAGDA
ncbi:hypothetical protein SAMN06265365_111146 [Tistlia consotensis]|uniref:Uncharacterized protein n=1 Tax=Tistlia consotensis USBA 355 TaxID=560819 RepID=A0A1Y6BXW8_9PROT|nr:DUF1178 family protein [Tistlia consotensis]SMF33694.1 hypothetical protein SAMN05428998_111148 [Tistlia consotensis USBA 355]SNR70154.1 hypothetical protein SAMN06265365_111146 [Tistlia consotensis]